MIQESSKILEKVIYLLQSSISPVLDDFKFQFDYELVDFMAPGPNTAVTILKNEPIDMFVFLNEKFAAAQATKIEMSYFDSVENKTKQQTITISLKDAHECGDMI